MRLIKKAALIAALIGLGACSTTTRRPGEETPAFGGPDHLGLCAGMGVSNAPSTDGLNRIIGYTPYTEVSGVVLARAPVDACLSSGFGKRRGGASGFHEGIDLYTRTPRAIVAGGDGVVETVGSLSGYGRTVLIRHNARVATRYAHLSAYAKGLRQGDRVRAGALLGYTGDSGNATAVHLHYEIIVDGRPQNPIIVGR